MKLGTITIAMATSNQKQRAALWLSADGMWEGSVRTRRVWLDRRGCLVIGLGRVKVFQLDVIHTSAHQGLETLLVNFQCIVAVLFDIVHLPKFCAHGCKAAHSTENSAMMVLRVNATSIATHLLSSVSFSAEAAALSSSLMS